MTTPRVVATPQTVEDFQFEY